MAGHWNTYFMDITKLVSKRSTCLRRQVGAILVRDKQILSTGYNGSPRKTNHCIDIGCLREQLNIPSGQNHELCRGVHAEQNTIIQAAYNGINIKDSIMYTTHQPCSICIKMLINARIEYIYYLESYNDELSNSLIKESGIKLVQL